MSHMKIHAWNPRFQFNLACNEIQHLTWSVSIFKPLETKHSHSKANGCVCLCMNGNVIRMKAHKLCDIIQTAADKTICFHLNLWLSQMVPIFVISVYYLFISHIVGSFIYLRTNDQHMLSNRIAECCWCWGRCCFYVCVCLDTLIHSHTNFVFSSLLFLVDALFPFSHSSFFLKSPRLQFVSWEIYFSIVGE